MAQHSTLQALFPWEKILAPQHKDWTPTPYKFELKSSWRKEGFFKLRTEIDQSHDRSGIWTHASFRRTENLNLLESGP